LAVDDETSAGFVTVGGNERVQPGARLQKSAE
jgi:hypothetical protein